MILVYRSLYYCVSGNLNTYLWVDKEAASTHSSTSHCCLLTALHPPRNPLSVCVCVCVCVCEMMERLVINAVMEEEEEEEKDSLLTTFHY